MVSADRDMVRTWRNSPEVARWMITDRNVSEEEHRVWFERVLLDPSHRYWVVQDAERSVGVVSLNGIDVHHERCSWAFYIGEPSDRGRGVGAAVEFLVLEEAFVRLGLKKLCGEVLSFNEPILRLHRKFGYIEEGRLVAHIKKNHVWHDLILIAHFRERWLATRDVMVEYLAERKVAFENR